MNDNDTHNDDPNDRTVPAHSVPPVSSGMHGQGDPLLRSGMMLPPQAPGILGRIGKYPVIRILGEGGMGQVLLAREPVTDSLVAIKLIKPEFLNKQWAVHRFLTEARHMYKMSHPSIIRVLDVSDRPEGPYFVMPYMAGGSLAGKIQPGEPLQAETILPVARAVAEALLHAHTRGITHRDLKPSNILLDAAGQAHLADFGLLRTFNNDTIIDASQPQMEGTVPYMSPAVAAGKAEDTRSDIYSFGCLLYEMLTGHPPYQGFTVDAVLKQIQDGPPPPIRQLNPGAPAGLAAICDHAMARELRDRYASMGDVVAELERLAKDQAPVGPHGAVGLGRRTRRNLAIAGAAVVVVAVVAFVLLNTIGPSRTGKSGSGQTQPVPLVNATATFSQDGPGLQLVAQSVDGVVDEGGGWGINPQIGDQTAVFETASDVGFPGGTILTFTLIQAFHYPNHTLGRFRLSATSDSRNTFADGRASGGDVEANWIVLEPAELRSANGASLTRLADHSILAGGNNPSSDTYTISATTTLTNITGIRLEALQHSSLPKNGPGRHPLGNFVLSELRVDALQLSGRATPAVPPAATAVAPPVPGTPPTAPGRPRIPGIPQRAVRPPVVPPTAPGTAAPSSQPPSLSVVDQIARRAFAARAQNLITNGGFDVGPLGPDGSWRQVLLPSSTQLPGWTIVENHILRNFDNAVRAVGDTNNYFWLSLNGNSAVPPFGGVAQTITTEIGKAYRLSLDLGAWNEPGDSVPGGCSVLVSAGSTNVSFANTTNERGIGVNRTYSFVFVAEADKTSITIRGKTGRNCIGLDNVSVESVSDSLNEPTKTIDLGNGIRMEFVLIRPGSFLMGSETDGQEEKPVHEVTLTRPFYLGKFEVTQEQWQTVMGNNPSRFKGPKLPVDNVSWNDCQGFLAKLQEKTGKKFALPTEAQWEYACRAGTTNVYSFGDNANLLVEYGWYSNGSKNTTHPVGEKKPNPWELYDMHGNVWEWCADWYASYPNGNVTDPQGSSPGETRVYRGGAWDNSYNCLWSANRGYIAPSFHNEMIGFRCALLVDGVAPSANPVTPPAPAAPVAVDWRSLLKQADAAYAENRYDEAIKLYDAALAGMEQDQTTDAAILKTMKAAALKHRGLASFIPQRDKLPADKQVEAIQEKLRELNPNYNGKGRFTVRDGKIVEALLERVELTDLSPLKGLPITRLNCGANGIRDLSPLWGMPIQELNCSWTQVADLSPLKGMRLTSLDLEHESGGVTDLSPLKGMPLKRLHARGNRIKDLSPLQGMPLEYLDVSVRSGVIEDLSPLQGMPLQELCIGGNRVSDLSPLRRCPLKKLTAGGNPIRDLSPLKGLQLTFFDCPDDVTDLSPLAGMPISFMSLNCSKITDLTGLKNLPVLQTLTCVAKNIKTGWEAIRQHPTLKMIEGTGGFWEWAQPTAEFWKRFDAGEFTAPARPAAPVSSAAPANLLANSDFELEGEAGKPVQWNTFDWSEGKKDIKFELSDEAHSGKRCLAISSKEGGDGHWLQIVKVEPYRNYRFSGWVKTQDIVSKGGNGVFFDTGPGLGHVGVRFGRDILRGSNDWQRFETVFNALHFTGLNMVTGFGGRNVVTGKAWYDDLSLVAMKDIPRVEGRVSNGSFEEADEGWPLGWSVRTWSDWTPKFEYAKTGHTGSRSVKILAQPHRSGLWAFMAKVKRNTSYKLSGWIRTENLVGGARANLAVGVHDWFWPTKQELSTEGLGDTKDWTPVSVTFPSGQNDWIQIACQLAGAGDTAAGDAWFDDIELQEEPAPAPTPGLPAPPGTAVPTPRPSAIPVRPAATTPVPVAPPATD